MNEQEKSRTEYSAYNTTVAVISRLIAILLGFVTRVVFTHTLSESYVGVNGLFSDILNVLALSELGVGTAITYALYQPIAEGNIEKQKSLMRVYCWFYRIVAAVVLTAGLCLIPFLDVLIKNQPDIEYLTLIYVLYLLNSVLSYLLIYKKTLIDAHQLSYIGTMNQTIFLIIQDVAQMIILIATHNFILFLCIYLVCTLGGNLRISRRADKMYPYLRDKEVQSLGKEERADIFRNIRAMFMHKLSSVLVNNTDNLLISSLIGIVSVGIYSNYYLVIGSVRQVLDQMFQGITASVGNLGVTEDSGRIRKIFNACFFIGQWLYGVAAICLYELLNPFVQISFGENYLFPSRVVLVLCVNFYVNGMRKASLVFRDSMGLFWYDRYKAVPEALINLAVSVLLGLRLGVIGVFLGTFVSMAATSVWVEPYVLYKHRLNTPVRHYFARYALYTAVLAAAWFLTDGLCSRISGGVVTVLILRFFVCAAVPNGILLLVYCRTKDFRFLVEKAVGLLEKRRGERRIGS
ncbi:MAG: lipopolysaccharide biosynthesis protein [Lachnospiraceae bacterium]|nr:lipopolysaccharide biosynthesis protein [Lachnospiraceae bacterium]